MTGDPEHSADGDDPNSIPDPESEPELELILVLPEARNDDGPSQQRLGAMVAEVLERSLPPSMGDDRFDRWNPGPTLLAALAVSPDGPVGYLGGTMDDGVLRLDCLVSPGHGPELEIATALYRALEPSIGRTGIESVELWGKPAQPWHEALAEANGFQQLRSLHQLRCPLPVEASPIESRPFRPGLDDERLVTVNNRAFASHPDQGSMTVAGLAETVTEPWFDPEGVRLYDDPDDPDRLAGFCWTKIHPPLAEGEPALGEIYVIGIDPDHHGKGLGVPMTAAGLDWMANQGLTTGMLYVEADNYAALRTYEKLGFIRHRTDIAWSRPVVGPEAP